MKMFGVVCRPWSVIRPDRPLFYCLSSAREALLAAAVTSCLVWISGCAVGIGAGVGIGVDTRGTVSLTASADVGAIGVRLYQDRLIDREYESAVFPLLFGVTGGVTFNPGAAILALDLPGVGFGYDRTHDGYGMTLSLHPRAQFTWPFSSSESSSGLVMGGVLRGAYLSHLSARREPPKYSDWPEQWTFQAMGPSLDVAVLHDGRGWFGHFTLGGRYQYTSYYMVGL